ncbi:MAG: hypothetical protein JNM57_06605 [Cyclobacteriaceae bacterium]|nr:hypothetical protein [Cyclobacteriaceae bacterium]
MNSHGLFQPQAGTKVLEPVVKPKPSVDTEVMTSIDPEMLEDSFVYVHCHCDSQVEGMLIRIWKTTFLIDATSGTRSQLVHAENISYAPYWTMIPDSSSYSFLLIFAGLPKSCRQFDLKEEIPQPGGFHITNIPRNEKDVYHINLF